MKSQQQKKNKKKKNNLPCANCGGKCCRYAPIETKVWERVKHKVIGREDVEIYCKWEGEPKEAWFALRKGTDGECIFLEAGRCSIYSLRPKACRAVGEWIPCAEVDREGAALMMSKYIEKAHMMGIKLEGE